MTASRDIIWRIAPSPEGMYGYIQGPSQTISMIIEKLITAIEATQA
jgi:hypothetical protein